MRIQWLGHAALKIAGSKTVFIDPFLSYNPKAALQLEQVEKADAVIVTHDHDDHMGDSFALCKKTGATLYAIFEITQEAQKQGIKVEPMNIGGTLTAAGLQISLVPAFHSGGLGGTAAGTIVALDGKTIYHAGDTGLSLEMQLIGEMYRPDIAFLPIDGRFTMTPRLAAKAVEFLAVAKVVPIHYDTFPAIQSSAAEFARLVGKKSQVIILQPGGFVDL
jgi:L-ascorbate metabolism protein UlaG (beta-lactamase superfamily)